MPMAVPRGPNEINSQLRLVNSQWESPGTGGASAGAPAALGVLEMALTGFWKQLQSALPKLIPETFPRPGSC